MDQFKRGMAAWSGTNIRLTSMNLYSIFWIKSNRDVPSCCNMKTAKCLLQSHTIKLWPRTSIGREMCPPGSSAQPHARCSILDAGV